MGKTWLDLFSFVCLALAIALVAYATASNQVLRTRLERLEEHRSALDTYQKTTEKWGREMKAEEARRAAEAEFQREVIDRLDAIERCSCGADG